MFTCTRILEFDAAHRVIGHSGACKMLHGHRYKLELTFASRELDNLGMVIDFGEIKNKLNTWIKEHWDHNIILNKKDKDLGDFIENYTGQKVYYLDNNPTAENIAAYLLMTICPQIFQSNKFMFHKIKLYETPNCFATIINENICK